ncbi:hypothetical protein [Actinoallomurus acaciae]|uniref:Uncharacterized protein n=1 Tax=Actinoallomurus acaciae TaxID=502577 RepID=A0ABV5YFN8_9ACTN
MIKATNDPDGGASRAPGDGAYDVMVLDTGEPRNAPAALVHGFSSRDAAAMGAAAAFAGPLDEDVARAATRSRAATVRGDGR